MSPNDQCSYGEQWIGGKLMNPRAVAGGYIADIEIVVNSESRIPPDAEVIRHVRKYGAHFCYKEVVINKERYDELMAKEGN